MTNGYIAFKEASGEYLLVGLVVRCRWRVNDSKLGYEGVSGWAIWRTPPYYVKWVTGTPSAAQEPKGHIVVFPTSQALTILRGYFEFTFLQSDKKEVIRISRICRGLTRATVCYLFYIYI